MTVDPTNLRTRCTCVANFSVLEDSLHYAHTALLNTVAAGTFHCHLEHYHVDQSRPATPSVVSSRCIEISKKIRVFVSFNSSQGIAILLHEFPVQAKFLTSRHVRTYIVIFYISNTLRKLMVRAYGLLFR